MLKYSLRVEDAKAHLFAISVRIPAPVKKQRVSLPVWIPGSYLIREFAKHLTNLQAVQAKREIPIRQLDKCTWEVDCSEQAGALELSWQIYAFDTSVRTAYLDERRGFVNGTSVFLRVHGFEAEPVELSIASPDIMSPDVLSDLHLEKGQKTSPKNLKQNNRWKLALALPPVKVNAQGFGTYRAVNYDELVDSPMEMGTFWCGHFSAGGVQHAFVVTGAPAGFDGKRLLHDTKRICETQIAFWHKGRKSSHKPPFQRYVFMLNAMDQGYGGLEHKASTALLCNRRDLPRVNEPQAETLRSEYSVLLGLISHEYFHAWNVKRMRPVELTHYDYTQENYTELLWFFEGFTSYYDDLMLLRSGVISEQAYLDAFAKNIQAVAAMPGRMQQSVAQASFDAWIKYYRIDENTPNITISYYTKGALVAFCLDACLRNTGRGSLDDVMRHLWQSSDGGPISQADILNALKQVGGRSFSLELKNWVHSVQELPVEQWLHRLGVKTEKQPATLAQHLGVKVAQEATGLMVKTVLSHGLAQHTGLAPGDEIVAINGWGIHTLKDWDTFIHIQKEPSWLLIARDGMLMRLPIFEASSHATQGNIALSRPASKRNPLKPYMKN